ncbi:hypothetical protein E2C01_045746 [Portunus trituberculatus]|uniref:Uncharacterized protein n=1 Tax=Portunus trituberculatus TaxID=210409 RepID=A0A5B7G2V2_PORTR|nr:hypothetical protein [Portunus trituberculatus]
MKRIAEGLAGRQTHGKHTPNAEEILGQPSREGESVRLGIGAGSTNIITCAPSSSSSSRHLPPPPAPATARTRFHLANFCNSEPASLVLGGLGQGGAGRSGAGERKAVQNWAGHWRGKAGRGGVRKALVQSVIHGSLARCTPLVSCQKLRSRNTLAPQQRCINPPQLFLYHPTHLHALSFSATSTADTFQV